jgi:hypothetical protein
MNICISDDKFALCAAIEVAVPKRSGRVWDSATRADMTSATNQGGQLYVTVQLRCEPPEGDAGVSSMFFVQTCASPTSPWARPRTSLGPPICRPSNSMRSPIGVTPQRCVPRDPSCYWQPVRLSRLATIADLGQ